MSESNSGSSAWVWVKAISTLALVGVVSAKIYTTPMALTVDFPTLLSLLLALFSVALAALFYFKATDTSNTFYDNTYKFTRDIAQLLAKMESGFGERLRHLDEGYASMRSYLQTEGRSSSSEVEETKRKLEEEKSELKKAVEERNQIVEDVLNRSQLQEHEKQRIAAQLREKEAELSTLQKEVSRLNRHLTFNKVRQSRKAEDLIPLGERLAEFTRHFVIERIGKEEVISLPAPMLKRAFGKLRERLPKPYVADLEEIGFFDDGDLSDEGVTYLRTLASSVDA